MSKKVELRNPLGIRVAGGLVAGVAKVRDVWMQICVWPRCDHVSPLLEKIYI